MIEEGPFYCPETLDLCQGEDCGDRCWANTQKHGPVWSHDVERIQRKRKKRAAERAGVEALKARVTELEARLTGKRSDA